MELCKEQNASLNLNCFPILQFLFVWDEHNHRIQLFNAYNGRFTKSYRLEGLNNAQFKHPIGLCIAPSGCIIVSESEYRGKQQRVQIFQ